MQIRFRNMVIQDVDERPKDVRMKWATPIRLDLLPRVSQHEGSVAW